MPLNQEPVINVGILASEIIWFELKGEFKWNETIIPKGIYKASSEGSLVCTQFAQQSRIELEPAHNESTFILKKVKIGIGFHWEQEEDQEFQGKLILQSEEKKIRAINAIGLENYLQSVISSEMSSMNDLNLLKAHAVVSRSWLLAQIESSAKKETDCHASAMASARNDSEIKEVVKWYDREEHKTFDVCADDHCQRYQGITKVISGDAKQAVDETRGIVLIYSNEICDARFSKCCGGITEDFENVWQPVKIPYLTSIIDNSNPESLLRPASIENFISSSPEAFCNTNNLEILSQVLVDFDQKTTDFFRWTKTYNQNELSELIELKSGIHFGKIVDLIPLERGYSGRIINLKIMGTEQTVVVGKELEIRKWLSKSHLYSSAFIVEKEFGANSEIPSKFTLKGAGWGHGVGMCQIGAAAMSQKGYNFEEILVHYFKSANLNKYY